MAHEIATFAGGCFWGVEDAFRSLPGVISATSGYTGGHTENPTYEAVCSGRTGHAEAVQVEFDPEQIDYAQLLNHFWTFHDPTQKNRQGPDLGDQYRSTIFFHSPEQQEAAEESKRKLEQSGRLAGPVATEITPLDIFYTAEEYHQQYLAKHGRSACKIGTQ